MTGTLVINTNTPSLTTNGGLLLRNGNSAGVTVCNQIQFSWNNTNTFTHVLNTRHNTVDNASNALDFYVWQSNQGSNSIGNKHVMSITSVGTGIGTTAPQQQLHVVGKMYADTQVLSTSNSSLTTPSFAFQQDSNTGIYYKASKTVGLVANGSEVGSYSVSGLTINSNISALSNVSASGNVLAALRAQSSGLQINRKGAVSPAVTTSYQFYGYNNASYGINIDIGSNSPASSNSLRITWSNNTEVMRVQGNGYVGINVNNPSYELHVGGTIFATGDIAAFSDKRVKQNIEIIDDPLAKVQCMSGYTFDMLETKNSLSKSKLIPKYTGLLAQEVQEVLPEVIHKDENGYLSVAYGNLAGLFVECIKELTKEKNTLKEELAVIKEEIINLRREKRN
jgi:hypothetical protein